MGQRTVATGRIGHFAADTAASTGEAPKRGLRVENRELRGEVADATERVPPMKILQKMCKILFDDIAGRNMLLSR